MFKSGEKQIMKQKAINEESERILLHYIGVLIACADECEKFVPGTTPKIGKILDDLIKKIKSNRKQTCH